MLFYKSQLIFSLCFETLFYGIVNDINIILFIYFPVLIAGLLVFTNKKWALFLALIIFSIEVCIVLEVVNMTSRHTVQSEKILASIIGFIIVFLKSLKISVIINMIYLN